MTPKRWQQIEQLYHVTLERAPEEREAFVSEACAGDEELRREVESLLASHDQAASFIEAPPADIAAGMMAEEQSRSIIGRTLGHYELRAKIGAGGMGEVYRARDTRLDRDVAVKILPEHLAEDAEALRRFEREAKAVATLSHPNILSIFDFGTEEGISYAVMELLKGETLRARIQRGALDWRETVEIGSAIAEGLAAAHAKNIIHRDLKPENIFLTSEGQVKILDFGIARVKRTASPDAETLTNSIETTKQGMVMGTLGYMSPEQVKGEAAEAPSDIFSLGCVLYEMVSDQRPFVRASVTETIAAILRDEPMLSLVALRRAPTELTHVLRHCLEKEPRQRCQTAREVVDILRVVSQTESFRRPFYARGRVNVALVLCLIVTVTTAALHWAKVQPRGWFGFGPRSGGLFETMQISRLTTDGQAVLCALAPDGKFMASVVEDVAGQRLLIRQMATASNAEIIPPAAVSYQRLAFSADGNFINYLVQDAKQGGYVLCQIPTLGGRVRKLMSPADPSGALSLDGKWLAYTAQGGSALKVTSADQSSEHTLATRKPTDSYSRPAWSHDGKFIACTVRKNEPGGLRTSVVVVPALGGSESPLTAQEWFSVNELLWLADGSGLLLIGRDKSATLTNQIWYVSYPGGEVRRITNDLSDYRSLSLTADSRTLAVVQVEQRSNIWVAPSDNLDRARQLTFGANRYDGFFELGWMPNGKLVYGSASSGNYDIWVMESDGSQPRQLTTDSGHDNTPSVSPDGRWIVFSTNRSGSREIWRMDPNGENLLQLTFGSNSYWPRCTPDSNWVVYTAFFASGPKLWKVPLAGGEASQISNQALSELDISPDGKLIASLYYGGQPLGPKLVIVPFTGGSPTVIAVLPATVVSPLHPRWTRDGRALTYLDQRGGVSNLWNQPIDGGPPQQVTNFRPERIYSYAWSPDGKQFAFARGTATNDIVLIRDLGER